MRKTFFAAAAVAASVWLLPLASVSAETLGVPGASPSAKTPPPGAVPLRRGQSQASVVREAGEPALRYPPVGGDTPDQPEITRWDYENFSVYFEKDRVIDVVQKGDPAPVFHREQLQQAP